MGAAWIVLVPVVLAASCADNDEVRDSDLGSQLELEEAWAIPLPAGFEVQGAAADTARVLLWGGPGRTLLEWSLADGLRQRQAPPESDWIGAALVGDSVEFLRTAPGRAAAGGAIGDRFHGVEDVDHFGGQWFVSVRDSFDISVFTAPTPDSGWRLVFSYRTPSGPHRPRQEGLTLTTDGYSMVASARFYPFSNFSMARNGEILATFAPAVNGGRGVPGTVARSRFRMISTGTHRIGSGFVQVLADPFSLDRVIVTFDGEGATLRMEAMKAPFGFLVVMPATSHILAIRTLDRAELVGYRWKWR